jgi:transcriptional regulator with XRE-family HTH domain
MSTVLTDEEAKMYIAENVRRLLLLRGMNQSDLARKIGESEMRISLMVRGIKLPSAAFLARVAEALAVKIDELLSPCQKNPRRTA